MHARLEWRPILVGGIFNTVNPSVYESREHPVLAQSAIHGERPEGLGGVLRAQAALPALGVPRQLGEIAARGAGGARARQDLGIQPEGVRGLLGARSRHQPRRRPRLDRRDGRSRTARNTSRRSAARNTRTEFAPTRTSVCVAAGSAHRRCSSAIRCSSATIVSSCWNMSSPSEGTSGGDRSVSSMRLAVRSTSTGVASVYPSGAYRRL